MKLMPKHLRDALEGLKNHCDELTYQTLKTISSEKESTKKVFLAGMLDYLSISRKAIDAISENRKSLCEGCGEIAEVKNVGGSVFCFGCALDYIERREQKVNQKEELLREYQAIKMNKNMN